MSKKRLGEMLLESGVIDETQLLSALGHQRKWGGRLGQALIDLHLATEPQIVSALAQRFGYEVVNVSALGPSPLLEGALRLVPRELALRQTLLPIAADTATLTIAMGDPSNIAIMDELSFRTGRRVKVALAGDREIAAAVRRLYYADEDKSHEPIALDEAAQEPEPIPFEEPSQDAPFEMSEPILATDLLVEEDDGPVEGPPPQREETPKQKEVALLEALEHLARGEESALFGPAQLAAALARLLLERGLISEAELLQELARK